VLQLTNNDDTNEATNVRFSDNSGFLGVTIMVMPGAPAEEKIVVCHRTSSKKNPVVLISISANAVPPRLAHGDFLATSGSCAPPTLSLIAFHSNWDGDTKIYVMDGDGSNQTRITNNPAPDGGCDW